MSMMGRWVEMAPELLERIRADPSILDEVTAADVHVPLFGDKLEALKQLLEPSKIEALVANLLPEQRAAFVEQAAAVRGATTRTPKKSPEGVRTRLDLDKAWHGIHFLLCQRADEAPPPLGNAVLGGTEIGPDQGYGPVRYVTPEEVAEVAAAVTKVDDTQLRCNWQPQRLTEKQIYPGGWEEAESLDWLIDSLAQLRSFYAEAAKSGSAVLIYLA
jgi:Domain of unknown function (DUF1877)